MAVDEDIPSFLLLEPGHFTTTSPRTMVELFHSAFSSFDEKTYFCMALICRPTGGLPGQKFAKPSYVLRPINIASHASRRPNPSRI